MQTRAPLPPQVLFPGGFDLTPRLGIDVLIDRNTGLLRTDRGLSLFDDPAKVERFGGAYSLPEVTVKAIQDAVQFLWKRGFFASLKTEQGSRVGVNDDGT